MLLPLSTLLRVKAGRRSGRALLARFAPLLVLTISLHSTGEFRAQGNFCAVSGWFAQSLVGLRNFPHRLPVASYNSAIE